MAAYCEYCGQLIETGARFCASCGAPAPAEQNVQDTTVSGQGATIVSGGGNYSVILTSLGTCTEAAAADLLEDTLGYSENESADLFAMLPAQIAQMLTRQQANYLAQAMTEYGMEVSVSNGSEYITIDVDSFLNTGDDFRELFIDILSKELNSILNADKNSTVFVIGLGNEKITPDALGPKVIDNLNITRHLFKEMPELADNNIQSVCAVSPGVLGITGIETVEVIKGISDRVKPCAIICIDALATRSIKRLSSSVQMTNTGITPGAGVGNRRHRIDEQTVGVPVIAIRLTRFIGTLKLR